jgi:hypothetical protein
MPSGGREMTPEEIAKALQAFPCVYESKDGELHGIGYLRVEEMDDNTVTLVFEDNGGRKWRLV